MLPKPENMEKNKPLVPYNQQNIEHQNNKNNGNLLDMNFLKGLGKNKNSEEWYGFIYKIKIQEEVNNNKKRSLK